MKIYNHADLRAYLRTNVSDPKLTPENQLTFETVITNVGKTPARIGENCIKVVLLGQSEKPVFRYYSPNTGHPCVRVMVGPLLPNQEIHAGQPTATQRSPIPPVIFDEGKARSLKEGKSRILVHGKINYTDTFDIPHWVTFCYYYPIQASDTDCAKHNDIDKNQ
jgi:hypothetical protein